MFLTRIVYEVEGILLGLGHVKVCPGESLEHAVNVGDKNNKFVFWVLVHKILQLAQKYFLPPTQLNLKSLNT